MRVSFRFLKFDICDLILVVDEFIDELIIKKIGKYILYCSYNYKII